MARSSGLAGCRKRPCCLRVQRRPGSRCRGLGWFCCRCSRGSGCFRGFLRCGLFRGFFSDRLGSSFFGHYLFSSGFFRWCSFFGRGFFRRCSFFRWCGLLGRCSFLRCYFFRWRFRCYRLFSDCLFGRSRLGYSFLRWCSLLRHDLLNYSLLSGWFFRSCHFFLLGSS